LELVRRFHELRTGQKITASHISPSEQQYAITLAEGLGYQDAAAFVDYGVKKARATGYPVNTLAGIKAYYPDFLQSKEASKRGREEAAGHQEQRHKEEMREEYATFRQNRAEELFAAASQAVREEIEAEALVRARAKRTKFSRPVDKITLRFERLTLIDESLSLPSFEEWSSTSHL
jgi:hypothetical protein